VPRPGHRRQAGHGTIARMNDASAERLLRDLAPLPYPRRMRELAVRARQAAAAGELRDLAEELARHGAHGRRLAAAAAVAGAEKSYLASRLTDPDRVVRRRAQRAAGHVGIGDYALEAALEGAPAAIRRELLGVIVTGNRTALADHLVDRHRAAWGDAEVARLLPACSPPTVGRLLPELFHAIPTWHGMVRRHLDALLAEAEHQLARLPQALRRGWWQAYAARCALAAERRPERVLDLLERYHAGPLPWQLWNRLNRLAAVEPARTLRLLLAPHHAEQLGRRGLPRPVLRRLVSWDLPELRELSALGRAWARQPAHLAELLRALPPSRRADFYDAAMAATDALGDQGDPGEDGERVVERQILDLLPHARRHAEARRKARWARERQQPRLTELTALAYLPPAEARPALLAATRHPDADERAAVWRLLIHNAARSADPGAVTAVLADAERLRNEQDPVRSAALDTLAGIRPGLFTDEAVDHLDRIAAEAIAARDSSAMTRGALNRLACSVLREHAVTAHRDLVGWALRTIVRLSGHTGGADLGRLDHTLRRGQEHQVFEALRPWLEAGAEKVDHGLTFALARAVGRRAAGMPELQELLHQAIQFGTDATVRTAAELWLAHPVTRDERATEIIALDQSAAVLPPVLRVLTLRRTDLLDVVLDDTPPYGRFLSPGSRWLPPLGPAVHRWLPRQQRAAARMYDREAEDAAAPTRRRADALTAVAVIPEAGAETVRRWTGSPDVALAEAALAALPWTDRPGDGLSELLGHADGDRARVAMYAATRAARYVPPAELAALLRGLLLPDGTGGRRAKVTSRKEAVRLAATRLPVPEAAALLGEVCHHPGQHDDVRAACVAFTTRLLSEEPAWRLLTQAASAASAPRRAVLRVTPLELPEHHRARYAQLVIALSDTRDRELAPVVHNALRDWGPWAPEATGVLARVVTDLDNRGGWRSATRALGQSARTSPGAGAVLLAVLGHLAAADAREDTPDAQADRDRPARPRVRTLVGQLAETAEARPSEARSLAAEAGELLAQYPDFIPDSARLLLASVDLDAEAATLGPALARVAWLHHDRPALAARTAGTLHRRLTTRAMPGSPATLLAVARELAGEGSAATGQFAVQLTRAGGTRTDWPPPWRELVRWLRRHPVPDVRDVALALRATRT
jgi:hypothetical protein